MKTEPVVIAAAVPATIKPEKRLPLEITLKHALGILEMHAVATGRPREHFYVRDPPHELVSKVVRALVER